MVSFASSWANLSQWVFPAAWLVVAVIAWCRGQRISNAKPHHVPRQCHPRRRCRYVLSVVGCGARMPTNPSLHPARHSGLRPLSRRVNSNAGCHELPRFAPGCASGGECRVAFVWTFNAEAGRRGCDSALRARRSCAPGRRSQPRRERTLTLPVAQTLYVKFGVDGYPDRGMTPHAMDALALERARYLQGLVERLNLGTPVPVLHTGGRAPEDAIYLGTGTVVLVGNVGEHACEGGGGR